jgi:adenylate cyclase
MIGDGVNLASRLEGACKTYGAHILASELTYKRLRGTYRAREIDLLLVKGKTKPIAVYEILDYHTDETYPRVSDALGRFRDGLAKYRRRDFAAAKELFSEVVEINPDDKTAQLYVKRCDLLAANPPPADWTGVWVMDTK